MHRRYNSAHLISASVIALGLTLLMVCIEAQARIAFMSDRDWHWEIYVMDANGDNQRNLSNNPAEDRDPSWFPDGKRIVFSSDRDRLLDIHGFPTSEIYVMEADGENPQNLTNNRADDWSPSWSPDGKRIVFMSYRDGHFIGDFEDITSEIYVMDVDGGNQQRLTENRKNDESPSWSPDGTRIVFSSDRKGDWVNYEIYVMDDDGGNLQRLTEDRKDDSFPSWSPDGKQIVFHSNREGNFEIYIMDVDGGNLQNLTNNRKHDVSPAWFVPAFAVEVTPFAVSPAGKKFTMWGWVKQVNR